MQRQIDGSVIQPVNPVDGAASCLPVLGARALLDNGRCGPLLPTL